MFIIIFVFKSVCQQISFLLQNQTFQDDRLVPTLICPRAKAKIRNKQINKQKQVNNTFFYRLEQEAYKTTPVFINNELSSLSKMANSNSIEDPGDSLTSLT